MDIKGAIEKIAKKLLGDSALLEKFKKAPLDIVKSLLGDASVTKNQLQKIAEGVATKVGADAVAEQLKGAAGKLNLGGVKDAIGGLFGKKG